MSNCVILVRHKEERTEDRVVTCCRANGLEPVSSLPFRGDRLDAPHEAVCACVFYGGAFNVFETDRHPLLRDEHRLIEQCMSESVPLLGFCQGAQTRAEQDGLMEAHDPAQHAWLMGFLGRFLGSAERGAHAAA